MTDTGLVVLQAETERRPVVGKRLELPACPQLQLQEAAVKPGTMCVCVFFFLGGLVFVFKS